MREIYSLQKEIKELIDIDQEGSYWDFKEKHHDNSDIGKTNLLFDIICMANNLENKDAYIIFGVDEKECRQKKHTIVGINNDDFRRTQAQITQFINSVEFVGKNRPVISLKTIEIDNKEVDILIVHNSNKTPYVLSQQIQGVYPYHVYTRINDTNTCRNGNADPNHIEYLWKKRFGLDLTPKERLFIYIKNYEAWKTLINTDVYHYEQFPEFTYKEISIDNKNPDYEWARGEIGYMYEISGDSESCLIFYYHSTPLINVRLTSFDATKKIIVTPSWSAFGKGRLYYYLKDSFDYSVQKCYLSKKYCKDDSEAIKKIDSLDTDTFDIPVFEDRDELAIFIKHVNSANADPTPDISNQNELFYNLLDKYEEFRNERSL